jgi:galactan endo-1,6-beta-galactosidase
MGRSFFTLNSPLPTGITVRGDGPYTVGNVFTVASQNVTVDRLGVVGVHGSALYSPVRVGLWSGDGTILLGSVTVGPTDTLNGGYRYHALAAPLTLSAGASYLIGARVGSGSGWFYDTVSNDLVSADAAIFLGDARCDRGTEFAPPVTSGGFVSGWAAANATFVIYSPPVTNGYSTTINPGSRWGTWDGWGVSLCWWANVFGTRDDLADLLFTTNYTVLNGLTMPGLGLNIARYNAGGCGSNSVNGTNMQVSPNILAFRQIEGFWQDWNSSDPASGSWNWTADASQRAMLLKARERGANLLELFSNSPMWWMCYNHNPSGAKAGLSDNLQSWNCGWHAVYLAAVAKYAKDNWGITFDSVEAFNEPSTHWWTSTGTQEGCHFDVGTQATVIGCLRNELDSRGLTAVNVAASDENTFDAALATWDSFNCTVRGQVGRVNTHGYQYGSGRRDLLYSAAAGKKLWDSEYGEGDASGMSLATNLNLDFHWLHPTGWCYWQALDSGGWGLIQSTPGNGWIGSANRKYFVVAQYTRHIRPGMTIIDGGEGNTVAAYDPVARKLVVVTANYGTAQWITYNLANFPSASGPVRRWITVTGTGPNYQCDTNIVLSQRAFKAWFPANTVQTFQIQNVNYP